MHQIQVEHLSKQYKVAALPEGRFRHVRGLAHRERKVVDALSDVSFTIDEGEMVGYIGPNGAGKSTTVKALSGILVPSGGTVRVLGRIPWKERVRHVASIGVMFGQRTQLLWDLPVADSFELLRRVYKIQSDSYAKRLNTLNEMLDTGSLLRTPVRQLSLGQRQRCDIVAALLHSPKILFLDEPTLGLDAPTCLALRAFLKELNRSEALTVLLTTYDMDDISALTPRVIFIAHGNLLYDGAFDKLKLTAGSLRRMVIETEFPRCPLPEGAQWLDAVEPTVLFDPAKLSASALLSSLSTCAAVEQFRVEEQSVDEIIARLYALADRGGTMTQMVAWFAARFKAGLQYRAAALAGVFTQLVFGMARALILLAFYRASPDNQPMDMAQAVTYVWLGQLFLRLMPWSDSELEEEVRTGQIAYNLLRPMPLLGLYFSRSLAYRVSSVLLRVIPFLPILLLLPEPYRMSLPASLAGGMWWGLSMVGAALLSAAITCALTMFCFRSVVGDGMRIFMQSIANLLGGLVVPLPLFPDQMQTFLFFSPFSGLSDLPNRLYMGNLSPSMGAVVVGLQLFWCFAFLMLARAQMNRSLVKLDILGG